jgi:hypothetical protein
MAHPGCKVTELVKSKLNIEAKVRRAPEIHWDLAVWP